MAVAQHEILPGKALIINLNKILLGNKNSLQELNWMLTAKRMSIVLIYLTEQNMASAWDLIGRENLLHPDVLVTESGSEVRWSPDYSIDQEWERYNSEQPFLNSGNVSSIELALRYLRDKLRLKKRDIVLCGNNEILPLFEAGYQGVLMRDKHKLNKYPLPNWVYKAAKPYAGGILEGLKHYNFGIK
ncbi:HAD family hydrolase [Desulfolucanica intricata]|uniref:HAD family hydrolase n=1 Tax=Desulfolucanica intricata TaxID=1285191 RepID=UPI000829BAC3|nr:HAD family hydrolase [Desulfolucanica intricata]